MFCELCCMRGIQMKAIEAQLKEMLQKLGSNIRGKNNSSQAELLLWICRQCEQNVMRRYESKLKSERAKESCEDKTELKEILDELLPKDDLQDTHLEENNNCIQAINNNNNEDVNMEYSNEYCKEIANLQSSEDLLEKNTQSDIMEIFDEILKEEPCLTEYNLVTAETVEDSSIISELQEVDGLSKFLNKDENSSKNDKFISKKVYKKHGKYYICCLCPAPRSEKFTTSRSIQNHIKSIHFEYSHNEMLLAARIAAAVIENPKTNEEWIKCDQLSFNRHINFVRYYKKEANYNVCLLCQDDNQRVKFKRLYRLKCHLKYRHFEFQFVCTEEACDYRCKSNMRFKKHYQNMHSEFKAPVRPTIVFNLNPKCIQPIPSYKAFYKKKNNLSYECNQCKKTFTKLGNVGQHIRFVHIKKKFYCRKCCIRFTDAPSIDRHNRQMHNSKGKEKDNLRESDQLWGEHSEITDETLIKEEQPSEEIIEENLEEFIDEPHTANTEEKTKKTNLVRKKKSGNSVTQFEYRNTYKIDNNKYYKCMLCPTLESNSRKFPTRHSIYVHIKYCHFNHRYICTECGWKCCRGSLLRTHYEKKHQIKAPPILATSSLIKPSIYDDKYKNQSSKSVKLIKGKHYRKEGGHYSCLLCLEKGISISTYKSLDSLSNHLRFRHFKLKFKCTDCDSSYVERKYLVAHIKLNHCRTEPLALDPTTSYCLKEVPSNYYSKKHNDYVCKICQLKFKKRDGIYYHVKTVHFGIKYKCSECDLVYMGITNVKDHMNRTHNIPNATSFITLRNMNDISKLNIDKENQKLTSAGSDDSDNLGKKSNKSDIIIPVQSGKKLN